MIDRFDTDFNIITLIIINSNEKFAIVSKFACGFQITDVNCAKLFALLTSRQARQQTACPIYLQFTHVKVTLPPLGNLSNK